MAQRLPWGRRSLATPGRARAQSKCFPSQRRPRLPHPGNSPPTQLQSQERGEPGGWSEPPVHSQGGRWWRGAREPARQHEGSGRGNRQRGSTKLLWSPSTRGTKDGGPGPAPLSTCKRCLGSGRGKCAGSRERRNSFSGVLSSPARDSEQRELESQSRGSANHRQDSTRHLEADPDPKLPTRIGRERALTQCSCKTFMYLRSLFE